MFNIFFTILAMLASLMQASADIQITPVSDHVFDAPASPVWHNETQSVYFCELEDLNYMIARFDYRTKEIFGARVIGVPTYATLIIPVEGVDNQFLISSENQIVRIYWDGRSPNATIIDTMFEVETDAAHAGNIVHFAHIDPENRFYCGTRRALLCFDDPTTSLGSFYVYTKERGVQRIFGEMLVTGGMGWNVEKQLFYALDDCENDIIQLSYTDNGTYYDEQKLFHFSGTAEYPDVNIGNAIMDSDGHMWTYYYGESSIFQLDMENRRILRELTFPTPIVAGLTFGGPNLDILFVITQTPAITVSPGQFVHPPPTSPLPGKVYQVTGLGTTGTAGEQFRL